MPQKTNPKSPLSSGYTKTDAPWEPLPSAPRLHVERGYNDKETHRVFPTTGTREESLRAGCGSPEVHGELHEEIQRSKLWPQNRRRRSVRECGHAVKRGHSRKLGMPALRCP